MPDLIESLQSRSRERHDQAEQAYREMVRRAANPKGRPLAVDEAETILEASGRNAEDLRRDIAPLQNIARLEFHLASNAEQDSLQAIGQERADLEREREQFLITCKQRHEALEQRDRSWRKRQQLREEDTEKLAKLQAQARELGFVD